MTQRKQNHTMELTSGPLMGKVLLFSLPIMLSGVLQLVFNAADTIVVGRFAGNEALAAVGSVGSLNNLLIGLFIGLSIGSNVMVARYTGAKNDSAVSDTVHTSVLLSILGGLFLTVVGVSLARPLLLLMGTPEDVIGLAVLYIRIIFIGMPVQMLYNFSAAILRAVGDTQRPLYYLIAAGVVNLILNVIFVVGFRLSVAGVALATILSQILSAALIVRALMTMEDATRLDPRRLRINPHILLQIVSIGIPAGIQSSVFSLSNVVIQSSVNSFGSIVIAGNAAASNIGNFVWQAMNTFQQTITSFASQNIGAGKPSRVISSLKACLFWALVMGLALGLGCCVFGESLMHLYTTDPRVIAAGMERMVIVCGPYFICGLMDVMTGVLRGIGYSLLPMIVSILGACVLRIIWVMTVFQVVRTLPCLVMSYPVTWTLTLIALTIIFVRLWKKLLAQYTPEQIAQK